MTSTLRTLLQELDRPDLDDAAKQVIQVEIEKFLGRNAREVLRGLERDEKSKTTLSWIASQENPCFTECSQAEEIIVRCRAALGEYKLEAHCVACGIKIQKEANGYCDECERDNR